MRSCAGTSLVFFTYVVNHVLIMQAERAPVVYRVVEAVPDAGRRGTTHNSFKWVAPELVWV